MLAGGRRPPCTNQPAAGAWQPSSDEVADDAAEAAEKLEGMIELVGRYADPAWAHVALPLQPLAAEPAARLREALGRRAAEP